MRMESLNGEYNCNFNGKWEWGMGSPKDCFGNGSSELEVEMGYCKLGVQEWEVSGVSGPRKWEWKWEVEWNLGWYMGNGNVEWDQRM